MSDWATLNPTQLMPPEVVTAISTVAGLLEDVLSGPAGLSVPLTPTLPSPLDAARDVANALLDTLQALLKGGRVHMLPIPIVKTPPVTIRPALPPTLDDLQAALDIALGPSSTAAADAYASMIAKTGGNAGFYNAFAQSLMDLADLNRPQYDAQHDAVVMVTLLVGAPRYATITGAATTLDLIVKPKGGNTMAARTLPVPQNVVGRVVGVSAPPGVGIRLDWDPPKDPIAPPYFPGVRFSVRRYAVIRSSSPKLQSATSVLELFPTQALTEGMTSGDHKVVAIGSGKNSAFLDTEAPIDATKPQFYCVTWEVEVTENNEAPVTLLFSRLSSVVKAVPKSPTPQQTGQSPDWTTTDSAINLFPGLAAGAQGLIEKARVLLKPSSSSLDKVNGAIAIAASATQRIAARSKELIDDVKRLATALSTPMPSLYITQMSSATGGNAFLMAELARRLNDKTDPARPPFDGGEYVCGVCIVAGAPRLADLASVITFFESLFGPADATNPLIGIVTAIDTVVTQAEAAVFGPNMKPLTPAQAAGVDSATGLPPVPITPVIADTGTPVATSDPANPNASDTNVTPTSELC
jgi:hypothetical protein